MFQTDPDRASIDLHRRVLPVSDHLQSLAPSACPSRRPRAAQEQRRGSLTNRVSLCFYHLRSKESADKQHPLTEGTKNPQHSRRRK